MQKKMLVALAILLVLSPGVFADGMMIRPCSDYGYNSSYYCPHREGQQKAVINYENGYENLLLFVSAAETTQSESFVWIFPIPAQPATIEIANLKGFPALYGTELKKQFKDNINTLALVNFVAVFPPAVLLLLITGLARSSGVMYEQNLVTGKASVDRGYEIWSHVTKYGVSTEVMTAWESAKFYHYLEVRGANLEPEAKKYIDEYIGKDYSFIVSWISNPQEYRQDAGNYGTQEPIGVFVRFPTEKIYYPMKMTSVYQNDYVPTTIDIIGFKQPSIFPNISKETRVDYYFQDRLQYGLDEQESALKLFNGSIPAQARYTRISINAQAKYFVQDLEMQNTPAVVPMLLETINMLWLLIAIAIFFLLSYAAMLVVNKTVLGGTLSRENMIKLALSNFLTIFGFIVAVFVMKETMKQKEKAKFSRLKTIPVFWALFLGFSILFAVFAWIINIILV